MTPAFFCIKSYQPRTNPSCKRDCILYLQERIIRGRQGGLDTNKRRIYDVIRRTFYEQKVVTNF